MKWVTDDTVDTKLYLYLYSVTMVNLWGRRNISLESFLEIAPKSDSRRLVFAEGSNILGRRIGLWCIEAKV
jgi:hypothetical protein